MEIVVAQRLDRPSLLPAFLAFTANEVSVERGRFFGHTPTTPGVPQPEALMP